MKNDKAFPLFVIKITTFILNLRGYEIMTVDHYPREYYLHA